jgi:hypothetical protein
LKTLADITTETGFAVLEHLEAEMQVPVLAGVQFQGDLAVIPADDIELPGDTKPVPADGIPVIPAVAGGHEHRLFASVPGTAFWAPDTGSGQDLGVLTSSEPCYLLHPEHGGTGVAPGRYVLRRQREQADEERLVAD